METQSYIFAFLTMFINLWGYCLDGAAEKGMEETKIFITDLQSLPPQRIFIGIGFCNGETSQAMILKIDLQEKKWELAKVAENKVFTGFSRSHSLGSVWFLMKNEQEGPEYISDVCRTLDGGQSWSMTSADGLQLPSSVRYFELLSESEALVSLNCQVESSDNTIIKVFKTSNYGKTWGSIVPEGAHQHDIDRIYSYPKEKGENLHIPIWREVDTGVFLVKGLVEIVSKGDVYMVKLYQYENSSWCDLVKIPKIQDLSKKEGFKCEFL